MAPRCGALGPSVPSRPALPRPPPAARRHLPLAAPAGPPPPLPSARPAAPGPRPRHRRDGRPRGARPRLGRRGGGSPRGGSLLRGLSGAGVLPPTPRWAGSVRSRSGERPGAAVLRCRASRAAGRRASPQRASRRADAEHPATRVPDGRARSVREQRPEAAALQVQPCPRAELHTHSAGLQWAPPPPPELRTEPAGINGHIPQMGPGKPAGVIPAVSGASSGPALKSVSDAGQCEERGGLRAWSLLPSWDCSSNSWHGQEAGICNYRISTVSRLSHRRTTANSALPPAEEQSRRRGTVPRAVPALPTPRSPSGTQRQVRHTAPRRTQRLRAAKPHPSSSQELSPAAPLPASLQHCTAHCSSLRVQADARLCFSMRGHTLSYKGNLFRLRKLM
eukprot:XP_024998852.1 transcription initiation factor TFIID subunit 4-like isoform X2 [Gallus gallus]